VSAADNSCVSGRESEEGAHQRLMLAAWLSSCAFRAESRGRKVSRRFISVTAGMPAYRGGDHVYCWLDL